MKPEIAIIIPARYGSKRFPGKPLAMLAGKTMLDRVVDAANRVKPALNDCADVFVGVATEDQRIFDHCTKQGIKVCLTSDKLESGSDRSRAALGEFKITPEIVLNLQGDNPLIPAELIVAVLAAIIKDSSIQVATPVIQLTWEGLDALRKAKLDSPFSGTCCIRSKSGKALWFSKTIIPAIREEIKLRKNSSLSPVFQHIGLYAFRRETLIRFTELPRGHYEELEGLEQLRILENDIPIQTVIVPPDSKPPLAGVDTKEDLERAERYLNSLSNFNATNNRIS